MPGYIEKLLLKCKHDNPLDVQSSPYKAPPKIYGKGAQDSIPHDTTKNIDKSRINIIQQVVGGVLYYARAVDNIVLVALRAIASEQTIATVAIEGRVLQLLTTCQTNRLPQYDFMHQTWSLILISTLMPPICQRQEQDAE